MHGVIFTNFSELVIEKWGMETWNQLLEKTQPENQGAYVGTEQYQDAEMVDLVVALSEVSGVAVEDLLFAYGQYLYSKLANWAPSALEKINGFESMLLNIDSIIHAEVRRLYPNAYVPEILTEKHEDGIKLIYTSKRRLTKVMEGLIHGGADFYGEKCEVIAMPEQDQGDSFHYLVKIL